MGQNLKKSILILGAGRSSSSLISYLSNLQDSLQFDLTIGDIYTEALKAQFPEIDAIKIDTNNTVANFIRMFMVSLVGFLVSCVFH